MFAFKLANFDFTQSRFFCDLVMLMLNLVIYPCGVQRPCHVDVRLCSEPAGPAHLLRQGAPVHLRWLQVARVQNLFWGEVSLNLWSEHHYQFHKKTFDVPLEKNSLKISWIFWSPSWSIETSTRRSKDHYHDHQLKPQLEDDPLRAERVQWCCQACTRQPAIFEQRNDKLQLFMIGHFNGVIEFISI